MIKTMIEILRVAADGTKTVIAHMQHAHPDRTVHYESRITTDPPEPEEEIRMALTDAIEHHYINQTPAPEEKAT